MMVKLFCEWDIGQEGMVFINKQVAKTWAQSNEHIINILADNPTWELEDLWRDGLLGTEPVTFFTGPVESVIITKREHDSYIKDALKLQYLECWGVDNWSGYDEAMQELRQDEAGEGV